MASLVCSYAYMYKFICFLIEDAHGARPRRPQHFWSVLKREAWHAWGMICCGSFLFGGLGVLGVLGSMQVWMRQPRACDVSWRRFSSVQWHDMNSHVSVLCVVQQRETNEGPDIDYSETPDTILIQILIWFRDDCEILDTILRWLWGDFETIRGHMRNPRKKITTSPRVSHCLFGPSTFPFNPPSTCFIFILDFVLDATFQN